MRIHRRPSMMSFAKQTRQRPGSRLSTNIDDVYGFRVTAACRKHLDLPAMAINGAINTTHSETSVRRDASAPASNKTRVNP
jgi:hypothetical protein